MDAVAIAKWIAAAIVLIVFYRKVIKPFIGKALELSAKEEIEEKTHITFDEDELEPPDNSAELRRRAERSLELSQADRMEQIKYDALREKLRRITEGAPRQSSDTIGALLKDNDRH